MRLRISRKRLLVLVELFRIGDWAVHGLGQGFTLSFQKIVADLSTLQLALHGTKRLPRRKDGLAALLKVSARINGILDLLVGSYCAGRHVEELSV